MFNKKCSDFDRHLDLSVPISSRYCICNSGINIWTFLLRFSITGLLVVFKNLDFQCFDWTLSGFVRGEVEQPFYDRRLLRIPVKKREDDDKGFRVQIKVSI